MTPNSKRPRRPIPRSIGAPPQLPVFVAMVWALLGLGANTATARRTTIRVGSHDVLVLVPRKPPLHPSGYPLVVALHGAGGRARTYARSWHEFHARYRLIIALPQAGTTRWRHSDQKTVLGLVAVLRRRYRVDPRRIYLVGFSRGGTYSYHFGLRTGSPFRAIAPFAAGYVELNGDHPNHRIPVCLVHGGKDSAVKPRRTKKMVQLLRQRHQPVRLRLLSGVGHKHPDEANRWIWSCLDRNFQLLLAKERRRRRLTKRPSKRLVPPKGPIVVKRGDTLWKLARRYGTSLERLKSLNGLRGERIKIGQRLKIR
ncbi:MAG: LysM peptidoglycan-binding domain-containing protein [Myxococcales bacterium]|nr:LysM peptidoglycan-binding domain-containing protein [Myxococcales bacterium]